MLYSNLTKTQNIGLLFIIFGATFIATILLCHFGIPN